MDLTKQFHENAKLLRRQVAASLFDVFETLCEGAIGVDADARVVWINEKYRSLLGLNSAEPVLGRDIEDVIPNSLMRHVVQTGQPILLDMMQFDRRWFVVTRLPLKGDGGATVGAIGFVLFDRLDYLKPLVSKFAALQEELAAARRQLDAQRRAKYTLSHLVGTSPAILEVKRLARRAAQLDTTVMLLGETGTGKELLAQAIHAASARASKPFVAVNVAAIPDTLLEAEFFGAAPGAYTGADRKGRDGKFKIADGGTLFLDEVGDMPIHVQAKLLRALQEQEIEPLGSNKVVAVDLRVIAATSRDLKALVDEGKFRPDLYFRLNVLPITLPPLRERPSDLEPLCEVLLEGIARRAGMPQREIAPPAFAVLARHDWPGNVRELRNMLERACAVDEQPCLGADAFSKLLYPAKAVSRRDNGGHAHVRPLSDVLEETERAAIVAALAACQGRKLAAAKLLGISRGQLYSRLERLGLMSDI